MNLRRFGSAAHSGFFPSRSSRSWRGSPLVDLAASESWRVVTGTRTLGLRRDRQRRGCGSGWQLFATVWNDWKSIRMQHRRLAGLGKTFQAASYTWVTVRSLAGRSVAEALLRSRSRQPSPSQHLDRLQALRGRQARTRPSLERYPHPGGFTQGLRLIHRSGSGSYVQQRRSLDRRYGPAELVGDDESACLRQDVLLDRRANP